MSNIAETPTLAIVCGDFCGQPIKNPDTDHAADCLAPLAERARIARTLRTMKAREVLWRCSCGEECDSQDDLAAHHTGTGHQGMYLVEPTGDEVQDVFAPEISEVDGRPARARRGPPREEIRDQPAWAELPVPSQWVLIAQRIVDEGGVSVGGLAAGKKCSGKQIIDGFEIDCPHAPAFRTVEVAECDLHKKHSSTLDQLCLIHAIRFLAADIPPSGLGPLFAENA